MIEGTTKAHRQIFLLLFRRGTYNDIRNFHGPMTLSTYLDEELLSLIDTMEEPGELVLELAGRLARALDEVDELSSTVLIVQDGVLMRRTTPIEEAAP